jgi:hypothetical protein
MFLEDMIEGYTSQAQCQKDFPVSKNRLIKGTFILEISENNKNGNTIRKRKNAKFMGEISSSPNLSRAKEEPHRKITTESIKKLFIFTAVPSQFQPIMLMAPSGLRDAAQVCP